MHKRYRSQTTHTDEGELPDDGPVSGDLDELWQHWFGPSARERDGEQGPSVLATSTPNPGSDAEGADGQGHGSEGRRDRRDGQREHLPLRRLPVSRDARTIFTKSGPWLDHLDARAEFERRVVLTQRVPAFLRGPFRKAMSASLEVLAAEGADQQCRERAWKLFLLAPRLLLHVPKRGAVIPKPDRQRRCDRFF